MPEEENTPELQADIEKASEYMRLLLDIGFPVHDVLEMGLHYSYADCSGKHAYGWNESMLYAAKVIRQAAHNLKIDAEWQERIQRMQRREISDLMHS